MSRGWSESNAFDISVDNELTYQQQVLAREDERVRELIPI